MVYGRNVPDTYQGQYKKTADPNWIAITGNITSLYDIDGLDPETEYEARVRATNEGGSSSYSSPDSATTDAAPVLTPANVMLDVVDHDTLRLTWSEGTGGTPDSYQGEYKKTAESNWIAITGNITSPYDIDGLDSETEYEARVRATDEGVSFSYSDSDSATTNAAPVLVPAAPAGLMAQAGDAQAILMWNDPGDSTITRYEYQIDSVSGTWTGIAGSGSTTVTATITSLTNGTELTIYLRAVSNAGDGNSASVSVTPVEPGGTSDTPSSPSRFTVDSQDVGVILLWDAPENDGNSTINRYEVYRNDGSAWTLIHTSTSAITMYTDTETLVDGQRYFYIVRAGNAEGWGSWSQTEKITINPGFPSAPDQFNADSQSSGVVMSWTAPADAGSGGAVTGYEVWRHDGSDWSKIATTGNVLVYIDTAILTVSAKYYYLLRAVNTAGAGPWSNGVTVIINPEIPSAPRRFMGDAQSTGVVLGWLAPADNGTGGAVTGYSISRWSGTAWVVIVSNTGNVLTYTDTTVFDIGSTNFYAMRAMNAEGSGEWSEVEKVIINPNVPSAPRRLIVIETTGAVVLSWDAPADTGLGGVITGYEVWRDDGSAWAEVTTLGVVLTYSDTATLDDGWHWWSVRAVNASGEGEWSNTAGITTATNVPSQPQSLTAIMVSDGVQLMWDAPSSDGGSAITGYLIERGDGLMWTELVADTLSTATSYTDTTVVIAGDGQYFYRVSAINANGQGDYSAVASTQVEGVEPGTPDAPTVVGTGANSIRASWRPGSGGAPVAYDLRVREEGSTGLWTLYFGVSSPYIIIGLIENTSYDVEVRAINSEGVTDWSATGTGSTGTASVRIRDDKVLSGGGGIHVTERPWPLYVGIRTRNGKQPSMNGISAQPSSYSWSAYGGPQSATVQLSGDNSALVSVLDWNGHNVIISDNGGPVWWGYVDKVTLSDGAWIIDSSIERQYNALRTHKQPVSTSPPSEWTEDTAQIDRYGRRELSLQLNDDIDQPTDEDMRELLEPYAGAHRGIEHSRAGKLGVTLHCLGHVAKLDWQYTARFTVGQYGDVAAFRSNVDGSDDWWRYNAAGANDDLEWAQFADFETATTTDVPSYEQYLSRIRFWQWRTHRTDTGRNNLFRLRSGGAGETPGNVITPEYDFTDLGGVDPASGGSVIDIDWATNVSPETLLPAEGWYFTLWQGQSRWEYARSHPDHLYWPSVRTSSNTNATTRLWGRAFSGVPQNKVGVWQEENSHLNFDFFTRLSTAAMVQEMLNHHNHIDFVGTHPTKKQTFAAYLDGTQKVGELTQQLAEFDDWFYWINPSRQLQIFRADRTAAFPITMRDDGRVQGRRPTDLSFVGRWIRYRGTSALCVGARFNARSGNYDVSFRGVPSAGQIRQQLLTR